MPPSMMNGVTDAQLLTIATEHSRLLALPVCSGCPDGRFAQLCREWMESLVLVVSAQTGDPWSWTEAFPGRFSLRLAGRELVVAEAVSLASGRHLQLHAPPEVDRLALALEKLDALSKQVEELRTQHHLRSSRTIELLLRLSLLDHFYGTQEWFLRWWPLRLVRPQGPQPMPAPEPVDGEPE